MTNLLFHSAKGTTWKNHKYIKRKNGVYYYPDNYEGGRHLPSNENDEEDEDLEDWEEIMYAAISEALKKDPRGFKISDIVNTSKEDFKSWLSKYGEIDVSKLSNEELDRMQKKVVDHYSARSLTDDDVNALALEVIRGNFGSGQERRELLGENYQEIQDRVNEILLGSSGSRKIEEVKEETIKPGKEAVEAAVSKPQVGGLDLNTVYSVYDKKKKSSSSSNTGTESFRG